MNLVVLHTLILVTQLSLFTYGKPSLMEVTPSVVEMVSTANAKSSESDRHIKDEGDNKNESDELKTRMPNYFDKNENFLMKNKLQHVFHKMTSDPASSSCNE